MNACVELIEYNVWANKRILSQIKDLTHEGFIKDQNDCLVSMHQAILHLLKADWVWLDLWKGEAILDSPEQWDEFDIEDIEKVWSSIQADTLEELKSMRPLQIEDQLEFSNGDETIRILKFWQTLNLVVNHGTYYRGQIANMIENLGFEPVKTLLFDYYTRRQYS